MVDIMTGVYDEITQTQDYMDACKKSTIKKFVVDEAQLISWRRHFHQHPEISGQETQTAAYLKTTLEAMGLKVSPHVFENGLVAILEGDPTKKCIALRADMDALPINECTDLEFKSQNPGSMHACGHDGHLAMVLGTAAALVANPPAGTVKFIFQPREEKPPGGAKYMVENGVLKNPDVDGILGFHVNPNFPVGTVGIKNSTIMAVADDFRLTISGRGGHGSAPQHTIDPITVSAEAITALQTVVSRLSNPMEPLVVTIGTIRGGTAQNIIPDKVRMTGTLRCLNNQTRDLAVKYVNRVLKGVCEAWGAEYELDYLYAYPPLNNNPAITDVVRYVVNQLDGAKLQEMQFSLLAGEDFAYYSQEVPAAYYMLGCAIPDQQHYPWHHACFTLNEDCLAIGVDVMANAITILAGTDK